MEKVKKSYVEKIYRGVLFSESSISEVEERDPMKVENDGKMQGFRFYDKEFFIDGEKRFDGEKSNFSKWIYYGKRLSLDEVKAQYGNNPDYRILISNMEGNGYQYVCHTQAGSFLPMQAGDMSFDELVAQKEQQDREWAEAKEKGDAEAKKMKYTLMREGLTLVKPETVEEWLQFVDNNSNDGYSVFVVKTTISMMKKMKEGISFEEAEQQVYDEELGLTGFMAGDIANALSHFAKQGEGYRKHWNKKYGIKDDDLKGTVNPAVLSMRKK